MSLNYFPIINPSCHINPIKTHVIKHFPYLNIISGSSFSILQSINVTEWSIYEILVFMVFLKLPQYLDLLLAYYSLLHFIFMETILFLSKISLTFLFLTLLVMCLLCLNAKHLKGLIHSSRSNWNHFIFASLHGSYCCTLNYSQGCLCLFTWTVSFLRRVLGSLYFTKCILYCTKWVLSKWWTNK